MSAINKFRSKFSVSLKLIIIGFLLLILMIPIVMVGGLIKEREKNQDAAFADISEKWGREQTVIGLILTVPYKKYDQSKKIEEVHYAHFLPENLNIKGSVIPESRKRGIYEAVVYSTDLTLSGEFDHPDFSKWTIVPEDILWDKAFISMSISDLRGVEEDIDIKWNNEQITLRPKEEINKFLNSGIGEQVPLNSEKYEFLADVSLQGSRRLNFVPVGRTTEVSLESPWVEPSFQGSFLPDNREITDNGFKAEWKVLEINRGFSQSFLAESGVGVEEKIQKSNSMRSWAVEESSYSASAKQISGGGDTSGSFGVEFMVQADEYQKVSRSLKYAILTLALTFLVLFFFEALNGKKVHPLQYILVGLALVLFYVLFLSIMEHLGFVKAYLIASVATIVLIMLYSKSIFKKWRLAFIESLILIFIYGFIFVILQLKDYSLLVGSIGLFIILAVVMYTSRKIDWYNPGKKID